MNPPIVTDADGVRIATCEVDWQAEFLTSAVNEMNAELCGLRKLVDDDGFAVSFQTFGQYRSALLREIAGCLARREEIFRTLEEKIPTPGKSPTNHTKRNE